MELLKRGGKNATAGLNSQIKGSSAPFSFCFDKKIADYRQFICLCPLLVPGAVKRWLKSSRWWDRITQEHQRFVWNWRRGRRRPLPSLHAQHLLKKSVKLSLHEYSGANHCSFENICSAGATSANISMYNKRKNTQTHSTHFKAVGGIQTLTSQRGEMEETQGA